MATGRFVSYLRVSTTGQGKSGLGIEAQRAAVASFLNGGSWELLAEYVEVETGKNNDRPQLAAALRQCRLTGATLIVGKIDRLSRNAGFLLSLRDSGVDFVAADMPNANRMTVGIMAVVAEGEREMISQRTKAALGAAKARGVKLGGARVLSPEAVAARIEGATVARKAAAEARAADLAPTLKAWKADGLSLSAMAQRLTDQGVTTPRGGAWSPTAVMRALARLA
jgi:DNA invertase Pin-like site-specific DNA recombinase